MRALLRFGLCGALLAAAAACSKPPADQLLLERNRLTVRNTTEQEWRGVEIWLNHYFRVPVREIVPGGSFTVTLDQFVDSFGRRFDYGRLQITDVRLKARTAEGQPVEVVMPFRKDGLTDAFGGKK